MNQYVVKDEIILWQTEKKCNFASSLVSNVDFPQGIKRECRASHMKVRIRQQFPLL